MKTCKDCFEKKEDNEFYGMQGECKSCTKKRVKAREELLRKNPNWVEKEKKRGRDKYHRLNYKGLYKPTFEAKKESIAKYKNKFPEKTEAKKFMSSKIKSEKGNLHHWSYNKEHYLDVIDLTVREHNKAHRFLVYDQERMMYRRTDNNELLNTKERHLEWIMWCIAYKED